MTRQFHLTWYQIDVLTRLYEPYGMLHETGSQDGRDRYKVSVALDKLCKQGLVRKETAGYSVTPLGAEAVKIARGLA